MNALPIKFRQPVFTQKGEFDYFHIWGIGIEENGVKINEDWLTGFTHITYPAKSDQATGTHDRFGAELFFNDILEDENGGHGVLVWQGDCLGIASGQVGNYHAIDQVRSGELRLYTRVGNIYENPEMVQGCMFKKGMVFYSKHLVNKNTGKSPIPITVVEVKPKSNELVVSWGRDNTETWELDLCEKGVLNGDYYF